MTYGSSCCRIMCLLVFILGIEMSDCIKEPVNAMPKRQPTKNLYFKPVGHLNYKYYPGVFVPLRNGKILALDGMQVSRRDIPEKKYKAEDGQTYGFSGGGMVELFDPETGETKILTRLPFSFNRTTFAWFHSVSALELKDGRVLLVGRFIRLSDSPKTGEGKDSFPPIVSKGDPKAKLIDVAPPTEPDMFGLIYDWRNNKCEIVRTTPEIRPRYLTTLHLLPDGKVLILGGTISSYAFETNWKNFPETRALILDPENKKLSVAGNLLHSRYGHATVPLSSTKFLLFGGWGPSDEEAKGTCCYNYNPDGSYGRLKQCDRTREVELFDLETGTGTLVGHTLTDRWSHSAIPMPNGQILIHGGSPNEGILSYNASELFDLETGKTTAIGEPLTSEEVANKGYDKTPYRLRGEGQDFSVALKDTTLLFVYDWAGFIYDERAFSDPSLLHDYKWDRLVMPRSYPSLVRNAQGRLFVMGGEQTDHDNDSTSIEEFTYPERSNKQGDDK